MRDVPAVDTKVPLHDCGGLESGIRGAEYGLAQVIEAMSHVAHADRVAVNGGVDALAEHVLVADVVRKSGWRTRGWEIYQAVQLVEDRDTKSAIVMDVQVGD